MKVYWLKLRDSDYRGLGFGITAHDWNDAMSLLARASCAAMAKSVDETMIETWKEVEGVDELDQNHVVPNMGVILRRGVWFPNLPEIQ